MRRHVLQPLRSGIIRLVQESREKHGWLNCIRLTIPWELDLDRWHEGHRCAGRRGWAPPHVVSPRASQGHSASTQILSYELSL
jgi:hypothetical protein